VAEGFGIGAIDGLAIWPHKRLTITHLLLALVVAWEAKCAGIHRNIENKIEAPQ
jgi:hypothetical protein